VWRDRIRKRDVFLPPCGKPSGAGFIRRR